MRAIAIAIDRFFFEPIDVRPIACTRIAIGLVLLLNAALLWPELDEFFTDRGVLRLATAGLLAPGPRIDLFRWLHAEPGVARAILALHVAGSVGLLLGLFTRGSALVAFSTLVSLHHRNLTILNSGDTLLRLTCFFLLFSPCGRALSLDRLWSREPGPIAAPPFAQRLLQIQLCLVYLSTVAWKLAGTSWIGGTAAWYAHALVDLRGVPVPWVFEHLSLVRAATWGTLAIEAALPIALWVPRLRRPAVLLGIAFHLGLELSLTIPVFQWAMIAVLLCFGSERAQGAQAPLMQRVLAH